MASVSARQSVRRHSCLTILAAMPFVWRSEKYKTTKKEIKERAPMSLVGIIHLPGQVKPIKADDLFSFGTSKSSKAVKR